MQLSKAFAEVARKHLDGVPYPACRQNLVEHAGACIAVAGEQGG
jgi:hypothetical protein